MPLPNIQEFIGTNVKQSGFKSAQAKLIDYIAKLSVDVAASQGGAYSFTTIANFEANKVNVPANSKVEITSGADAGNYNYDGTNLSKSDYDPVQVAQKYTDIEIENLSIEKDPSRLEGVYLIKDKTGKYVLLITEDGTLKAKLNIKEAVISNGLRVNIDSSGLLTEIGLGTKEGVLPVGDCENDGSNKGEVSGFVFAIRDKSNRYAFAVTKEGKVVGNFDFTGLDLGIPKRYRMQQDESSNFQVSTYLDDANLSQLKVFNKSNGITKQLTISGNNVNPKISFDETSVLFTRELDGVSQYVHSPILSSEETIWPVNAPNMIIGWGDSMTAPGSGYFDVLMSQASMSIFGGVNQGIGGQTSYSIALRAAGINQMVSIENNTIPASGTVNITTVSSAFLNQNLAAKAKIQGVPGLYRNVFNTDGSNSRTFTVDASYSGPSVTVVGQVDLEFTGTYFDSSLPTGGVLFSETRNYIHSIRMGRNDVGKPNYSQSESLSNIASVVAHIQTFNKKFYVMGVTSAYSDLPTSMGGTKTETESVEIVTQITNLNLALSEIYGSNFVDIQAAMIAAGYGQTVTVSGNQYTVLNNIWSGDGVHESSVGKLATANHIINNVFKAKGWI